MDILATNWQLIKCPIVFFGLVYCSTYLTNCYDRMEARISALEKKVRLLESR